jgi:5-(carboxyamino)imidazole ribonucleotide synthase
LSLKKKPQSKQLKPLAKARSKGSPRVPTSALSPQIPGLKLGILGGGQLAQMLALAAYPYGILPQIYAPSSTEPAAQVSPFFFQGDLKDEKALESFLKQCDVVTFESEFLNASLLEKLSLDTQTPIFPHPRLMGELQDRLSQKRLLEKYKIPTAPWGVVDTWSDIEALTESLSSVGREIVLKQRRFGYDGYGTFFVNPKKDFSLWEQIQSKTKEGFIAESKIPFKRELALILARDRHGNIVDFPLVESKQTNARCDWVMGPIRHPKEQALRKVLKHFIRKEDYIGVIAFELFDTGKELLVNEIAPRVHNSGHYSQDALSMSQFQAHVMAVCNQQLFTPKVLAPFAMANLLGVTGETPSWPRTLWSSQHQGHLHWYGKKENRAHRKMGHINTLGKTPKAALSVALTARRKVTL